uniref:BPI2 domain-containing protein n=1 Tax=Strongyloides stercoralis TaxID=6248 RepID=A0A0K0E893_STRER
MNIILFSILSLLGTYFPQITSETIGQIQINKNGIEFFAKSGIEKLAEDMENETIPPYSGTGPKRLSYQFTNIDITSFKILKEPKSITLFGPKRVTVGFVNMNIKLNVTYNLKYKDGLTKTDQGTFEVDINNGNVSLGIDVINKEPFNFQPSICNVNIINTQLVQISGQIDSWINNEFNNSIKNYINPNLISIFCDNFEKLFTETSNDLINNATEPIEIGNSNEYLKGFSINYGVSSNPIVDNKFGIEIPINAKLNFIKSNKYKFGKYIARKFASDKHICIDLDFFNFGQYLIDNINNSPTVQSLGCDLIKSKLQNKIQQFFSCGCDDKSYCISDIIPDLDRHCTNYTPIALVFNSLKLTNISIQNDVIHVNLSQIVSFEIENNDKRTKLFKIEIYPIYILRKDDVEINDNKISGKVDIDMCKFKLLSSQKMDISDKAINKIVEIGLKDYIKKFVNTYLLKGIPLPIIKNYKVEKYFIEFSNKTMPICYNLLPKN